MKAYLLIKTYNYFFLLQGYALILFVIVNYLLLISKYVCNFLYLFIRL